MQGTRIAIHSILAVLLVGVGFTLAGFAFPTRASALEVKVQTGQLLPLGGNSCPQLEVRGFVPYVYNGSLHSFEFWVPDSSYVAVAGSAGGTSIPFQTLGRSIEPSGALHVRAELPTTPVHGSISITVTLLSAKGPGQPTCVSVVSTDLMVIPPAKAAPAPSQTTPAGAPTSSATGEQPEEAGTTTATATPIASAQNVLKDMCSEGNSSRLWFVLLALYALVTAAAALGQPETPLTKSREWVAVVITVPFLLLFGLWFFAENCRTSALVPVITTLIALGGLVTTLWEREGSNKAQQQAIPLPAAKK